MPDTDGFTGITGDGPAASILSSMAASFSEYFATATDFQFDQSETDAATAPTAAATNTPAPTGKSNDLSVLSVSGSSPTTFQTVTSPTAEPDGVNATREGASTTATNAASNDNGSSVTVEDGSSGCSSVSCSPGLQAAIAVPIVVAALLALFIFLFCARRRRRKNAEEASINEKRPRGAPKKWSRHLRVFSFDAELLMGGRFSSTNSLRSRNASIRTGVSSRDGAHSAAGSIHSVEEVAPPYLDAISQAVPPSPTRVRTATGVAADGRDPLPRPFSVVSTATAPPPYPLAAGAATSRNVTPTTPAANTNPFSDSATASPIDGSPFNDPPATGLSRNSSLHTSMYGGDDTPAGSDAGSIRQAVVGRQVAPQTVDNSSNS